MMSLKNVIKTINQEAKDAIYVPDFAKCIRITHNTKYYKHSQYPLFVVTIDNTVISIDTLLHILQKFIKLIESNLLHKNTRTPTTLTICINPLSNKKSLPPGSGPVTPLNINSAMISFQPDFIYIFRYEEWEKVLLHELLHAYKVDLSAIQPCITRDDDLQRRYLIESTIGMRWSEAIAESIASHYICSIYAEQHHIPLSDVRKHVLKHMTDIIKSLNDCRDQNGVLKQDTHAFEYLVAKTILFKKCKWLIRWLHSGQDQDTFFLVLTQGLDRNAFAKKKNKKKTITTKTHFLMMGL